MPQITEWHIQRAFTTFFKGEKWKNGPLKGQWKVQPSCLPGVVSWHTPNNGKREDGGALEGSWLKDIGLEPGIPDYFFLWGRLHFIEFKKPGGVLSPAQKLIHPRLTAAGAIGCTLDDLEDAKRVVRSWGLTLC